MDEKLRRLFFGACCFLALAGGLLAQEPAPEESPEEEFNPLRAEQSLKVGEFYLRKKNYDAAIDRFHDAIRYKPSFALPHRRLGEAYEKKREKLLAVEYYGKYLEILPGAGDAEKVRKRIAKLEREIERDARRRTRSP
jgi:Tfp pilus assembly protein PilF